ncbi:MAG TPA: FixH family protein [Burkholderiaceae bacterium]|nr:FixH family protein [Burkholderiaceae bacterium]
MQHATFEAAPCGCASCAGAACRCGCAHSIATGAAHRARRRAFARLAGALLVVGLAAACSQTVPANLDYATTRSTAQGAYRVSYKTEATPIPINRMHTWTLHVETADGRAVTDAAVKVDGDMPQHLHGLPTRPRVTRNLGNGDYLVEGVKFQMGGWWVVEFTITAGGRTDVAKFNVMLQG